MNYIDFNDWDVYDGMPEGSGRSEKVWLQCDKQIGLFKFPKTALTTEHISEHLAMQIGRKIGIRTAIVNLGVYGNRVGSMSYLITNAMSEFVQFITTYYTDFDPNRLYDPTADAYYSVEMVENILDLFAQTKYAEYTQEIRTDFYNMLVFDFFIGNSDRHQSNWGIRAVLRDGKKAITVCPLYDNGSSLCAYVTDEQAAGYLGRDENRLQALVDRQSKSRFRIGLHDKNHVTHKELLAYVCAHEKARVQDVCTHILQLGSADIRDMLDRYDSTQLSDAKKELIAVYLQRKTVILRDVFAEGV